LEKIKVFYRLSDAGYDKIKPDYIGNKECLINFLSVFNDDNIHIIADNVSDSTWGWLGKLRTTDVYSRPFSIERTQLGSGAQSFNYALDLVFDQAARDDSECIYYFVENDYLHHSNARNILLEGFTVGADYVSLYDHPDKYLNANEGGNPFIEDGGEVTKVYLSKSCHWKLTNSTTMTFASKIETLTRDESILRKWTNGTYPDDFKMFLDLRDNGRSLITSIPGFSTHGETNWLSPLTDWSKV
tara:strand:- start:1312 stop:2040 length:729 start_codon:yes stop_codon:yes gene_type:complete